MTEDDQNDPRWAAQRLAAVGSIAALLGHEARNRLTVVRSALEMIEMGAAQELTPEHGAAFLAELDRFLGDFNLGLDMVRCHAVRIQPLSARAVIHDAVRRFQSTAERAGVELMAVDQPEALDLINADSLLVRQSILNLLRNSIEAFEGRWGGRIWLSSKRGSPWLIEVQDDGPGLPPAMKDAGSRTGFINPAGGLGLALCRDAMTVMGGSFRWIPSEQTRGACFRLEFGCP
jgi:signal transduction histidine kinase